MIHRYDWYKLTFREHWRCSPDWRFVGVETVAGHEASSNRCSRPRRDAKSKTGGLPVYSVCSNSPKLRRLLKTRSVRTAAFPYAFRYSGGGALHDGTDPEGR